MCIDTENSVLFFDTGVAEKDILRYSHPYATIIGQELSKTSFQYTINRYFA